MLLRHDAAWARRAAELIDIVREACAPLDPEGVFAYDHIGSTAVPGLAAKPFLDLQVRVPVLPDADVLERALRGTGFRREHGSRPDSPGVTADTPRGPAATNAAATNAAAVDALATNALAVNAAAVVDAAVWRKWLFSSREHAAILHVRRADSPWAAYTIAFRDWLRADPANRDRYEAVKRSLATTHAGAFDYDDYTRAKTAYFDEIQPILDARAGFGPRPRR